MPGASAHELMQPRMADGSPFRLKHSTPPRKGGVLILFYEATNGEIKFPLIQRPNYEGIHSGQMALPGGKYEEEDGDQYATALRETEEEIGVDREGVEIIGSLTEFFVAASNYMVLPVLGKLQRVPEFTPDPGEVDEVVVVNLEDLLNPEKKKTKEMVVRGSFKMNCPYFDLEEKVVWGATAMILSELVEILRAWDV